MQGNVLLQKNIDEVRPIASITKMFVAQQSASLDQNEMIEVTKEDIRNGGRTFTPLKAGHFYTRRELTELALVSSDNAAAKALGRVTELSSVANATLVEASGLDELNQSTARKIAESARELYRTELASISVRDKTTIGERINTNPFLNKEGWKFYLSKTGFIKKAGGCLVTVVEVNYNMVTIVILGSQDTRERWNDLIKLRKMLGDTNFYVPVKVTKVIKSRKK